MLYREREKAYPVCEVRLVVQIQDDKLVRVFWAVEPGCDLPEG